MNNFHLGLSKNIFKTLCHFNDTGFLFAQYWESHFDKIRWLRKLN